MWKRPVRSAVRLGLAQPRIRSLVESELRARRQLPATTASTPMRDFIDRHGVPHPLDLSLRDRLKPQWRTMLDPEVAAQPPSDEGLRDRARKASTVVGEARGLVAAVAGVRLEGRILEIGCYDGAAAFQLARDGKAEVVASDMARYYVVQRPGEPADADIRSQQLALASLRARARELAGVEREAVEFVEDDITSSALEPGSFDAIVSFEVLEHIRRPDAAFAAMHRLLRPGAIGYHDYNPFFSLIGGHSLCTLDFPWGHARLDHDDFERYLREFRPEALAQTLRFYDQSLNRMSLADLRAAVGRAGLDLLAVIPWSDRTLVGRLTRETLAEVRRMYPTATAEDLLASFVAVVVRRPA
jgi:2-polyprenyl-3-methyl-5-hydroxy-6-metoxy-1,4-benzoquinol methylase